MKYLCLLSLLLLQLSAFSDEIVIDSSIHSNTVWTANNTYILDGHIYVLDSSVLTIEAGTVIKGYEYGADGKTSILVIARGSKIYANGTKEDPIIFTSELDDIEDTTDLGIYDRGLWGGLIVLGQGELAFGADDTSLDERFCDELVSTDTNGYYGGLDNEDNSGVLEYVSIRHAGASTNGWDEFNGLSLYAVGSQTKVNNVEVFACDDDGIEIHGGAVNVKHAIVSYVQDDSYDIDMGWQGKGQFWIAVQDEFCNRAGEHDGSKPDLEPGNSNFDIFNATYISSGVYEDERNSAFLFRDRCAGLYANSVFINYPNQAEFEDLLEDKKDVDDVKVNIENGTLAVRNSIWVNNNLSSTDWEDHVQVYIWNEEDNDYDQQWLIDSIKAWGNVIANESDSIFSSNEGYELMFPDSNGIAYQDLAELTDTTFFTEVTFKGAIGAGYSSWYKWTYYQEKGFVEELFTSNNEAFDKIGQSKPNIYPNPSKGTIHIRNIAFDSQVIVFDLMGKQLKVNRIGQTIIGLKSGVYIIQIDNGNNIQNHRVVVL